MPTILDEGGRGGPAERVQGVSLRPLGRRSSSSDLLAVAETYHPRYPLWVERRAAIAGAGRYRLVAAPRSASFTTCVMGSGETSSDVAASNATRADALERGLRDMLGRLSRPGEPR